MKRMQKRLQKKDGFTLAELLIVVAIIGVLVAIAIPTFSSQLEKSRIATDEANVRAWYAEQIVAVMDGGTFPSSYSGIDLKASGAKVTVDADNMTATYTADKQTGGALVVGGGTTGSTTGSGD